MNTEFSTWHGDKESACQFRRLKIHAFSLWVRKILCSKKKWQLAILFFLAWRIPWTKESGGLQSMGSQRVGHN